LELIETRKKAEEIAVEALDTACKQSGQRNFVWLDLLLLWPSAKPLLVYLSRCLGGEIHLPGDDLSLLARSIATGAEAFAAFRWQTRGKFSPSAWDKNMYVLFFEGFCRCAARIGCCRVSNGDSSSWPQQIPYIDWRLQHPGAVQIEWRREEKNNNCKLAVQLARRSLLCCGSPRTWANKTLMRNLVRWQEANATALAPSGSG
jgi:hypothetical protein